MKCECGVAEMRVVGEDFNYGDGNAEMIGQCWWCPECGTLANVSPKKEEDLRDCVPYTPANTVVTWESPKSP